MPIVFSKLRQAGKMHAVYVQGTRPQFETPVGKNPDGSMSTEITTWGIRAEIGDPNNPNPNPTKYSMEIILPSSVLHSSADENPYKAFLQQIQNTEEEVVKYAISHSHEWFKKTIDAAIVRFNFVSALKQPNIKGTSDPDTSRPPNIKAKVPYDEKTGQWNVEIYNAEQECLFTPQKQCSDTPNNLVPLGASIATILELQKVWIVNAKWGITWNVKQVCIIETKSARKAFTGVSEFSFSKAAPKLTTLTTKKSLDTFLEDSDEEDSAAKVQPAPEPAPEQEPAVLSLEPIREPEPVVVEAKKPAIVKRPIESPVPATFTAAAVAATTQPTAVPKKKVVKRAAEPN